MARRPKNDHGFFANLFERILAGVISGGVAWLVLIPAIDEEQAKWHILLACAFGLIVAVIRPSSDTVVNFLARWWG